MLAGKNPIAAEIMFSDILLRSNHNDFKLIVETALNQLPKMIETEPNIADTMFQTMFALIAPKHHKTILTAAFKELPKMIEFDAKLAKSMIKGAFFFASPQAHNDIIEETLEKTSEFFVMFPGVSALIISSLLKTTSSEHHKTIVETAIQQLTDAPYAKPELTRLILRSILSPRLQNTNNQVVSIVLKYLPTAVIADIETAELIFNHVNEYASQEQKKSVFEMGLETYSKTPKNNPNSIESLMQKLLENKEESAQATLVDTVLKDFYEIVFFSDHSNYRPHSILRVILEGTSENHHGRILETAVQYLRYLPPEKREKHAEHTMRLILEFGPQELCNNVILNELAVLSNKRISKTINYKNIIINMLENASESALDNVVSHCLYQLPHITQKYPYSANDIIDALFKNTHVDKHELIISRIITHSEINSHNLLRVAEAAFNIASNGIVQATNTKNYSYICEDFAVSSNPEAPSSLTLIIANPSNKSQALVVNDTLASGTCDDFENALENKYPDKRTEVVLLCWTG